MDLGIKNKIALVTAASQGLGKAAAIELANEGTKLAICSRNEEKINETAEEIQKLSGSEVLPVKADLDNKEDIENLILEIEKKFNTIDILINNTGGPKPGFFDDLSDEDWLQSFESTFLSAVRVTRKVLPFMKKNKWGRIVNISSVSAKQPIDNLMLSNGIRMSVHGWAKTLSNQVASDNILINNVCPGFTHTERVDGLIKDQVKSSNSSKEDIIKSLANGIPAKRVGQANELAALVAFLSSQRASYITGQSIAVDGGISNLPI
tara:strand:- start:523 stop:1314 length:792 start_codon:yes stop_codon:yes gene_type:complete